LTLLRCTLATAYRVRCEPTDTGEGTVGWQR
jgi:hypothetical protein